MTYYSKTRIETSLNIDDSTYGSIIDSDWGPDGDDEIDNLLRAAGISVPLTTVPDSIARASNAYARYRLYEYNNRSTDDVKWADSRWRQIVTDYINSYQSAGSGFIVASQSYRTYPLNANATPYRSVKGGANSTDDSDLS